MPAPSGRPCRRVHCGGFPPSRPPSRSPVTGARDNCEQHARTSETPSPARPDGQAGQRFSSAPDRISCGAAFGRPRSPRERAECSSIASTAHRVEPVKTGWVRSQVRTRTGIGWEGGSRPPSPHTTGHTGPYPAVLLSVVASDTVR